MDNLFDFHSLTFDFRKKHKLLSDKRFRPIVESFRRSMQFHEGRSVDLHLLARKTEVRPVQEYYKNWSESDEPRIYHWYALNEAGKQLIEELKCIIPWDQKMNEFLFTY